MHVKFSGLSAALVTPFTANGDVNYNALKQLVRHLINQGIDGFYVGGSTGECFLLTNDERKRILETVIEENNNEKFVVAQIGQISTDFAIDLAKHAKQSGADAISSINPFYYKFSSSETIQYYRDIMEIVDVPMFIYSFPDLTGFSLDNSLLQKMEDCRNLSGVKFTSRNFFELERMKTTNPELIFWNGYDEMLLSGLVAGADGGVGSTYCCLLPLIKRIYEMFQTNEIQEAQMYQQETNSCIEVIVRHGVFPSIKALLGFQGIQCGDCRRPFSKLTEQGYRELKILHENHLSALL